MPNQIMILHLTRKNMMNPLKIPQIMLCKQYVHLQVLSQKQRTHTIPGAGDDITITSRDLAPDDVVRVGYSFPSTRTL